MTKKETSQIRKRLINFSKDKDAVLQLHEESCWHAYIPPGEMSLEEFRQRMRATGQTEGFLEPLEKAIQSDPQTVVVWEMEERIVAFVWVKLYHNDFLDGLIADITEHAVTSDFQGSGLFDEIRHYAEDLARQRGAYLLRVEIGTARGIELNQWLTSGFKKQQLTLEKQLRPVTWRYLE